MIRTSLIKRIQKGDVVVYPTTTLPALGCIPNSKSLDEIYKLKNRSSEMPVSLGVSSLKQIEKMVEIPTFVNKMLAAFEKGSLTLMLPAEKKNNDLRLGGEYIAIRVLSHPLAVDLVNQVGPLVATSANITGYTPFLDTVKAGKSLGLTPDSCIKGICPGGLGSTFVKISKNSLSKWKVTIMREGIIPAKDVVAWWTNLT